MTEIQERSILSSDNKHELFCRVYLPEGEPKGLFHTVHGMTEHISRYDTFMRKMAEDGFICYGFDNLGHGHTAEPYGDLGYIGDWKWMVDDVRMVSTQMKAEFGESLPCVLMGHSMGSFIARCAATPRIWDKFIFMGTGGPNPASRAGLAVISALIKKDGERANSSLIEKLVIGSFSMPFKDENDNVAWLSNLIETRDSYRADKYCNFRFTLNGYYVLVKLQMLCNRSAWFKNVTKTKPILLVSGSDDPVGDFGKGVKKVYQRLKKNGRQAELKLYEGCRHEILNDLKKDEVLDDILRFVNQ